MNFDEVIDRRSTESLKWRRYGEDVLPLWVADMDFRCPPEVIDALHARVDHGIFGYGLVPKDLPEIVVDRMARLYNWRISPEDVCFVPGVVTGFNLALRAVCSPGDSILFQTPAYPPFFSAIDNASMQRVENSLMRGADYQYSIDFELFEKQIIDYKLKFFLLCNPQNPTGRVFTKDELLRMAKICLDHDVTICSDDIHCDLIYSGHRHIPMASLDKEIAARTITLIAPSKTYNIAGLHASVAIIQDPTLRQSYSRARAGLVSTPCLLSLTAARAAYLHGDVWLGEALAYLEANRDWLYTEIQNYLPGVRMAKPEGTFLAWLDCKEMNLEPSPYQFFLDNAKVGLNNGLDFGKEGQGFLRLNFGTPRSTLVEALEKMRQALKERKKLK